MKKTENVRLGRGNSLERHSAFPGARPAITDIVTQCLMEVRPGLPQEDCYYASREHALTSSGTAGP